MYSSSKTVYLLPRHIFTQDQQFHSRPSINTTIKKSGVFERNLFIRQNSRHKKKDHFVRNDPFERKTGLEPATPTLARWCSTN